MITVNMHEAKSRLAALVKAVEEDGETVVLCRNGKEVAEIRRRSKQKPFRRNLTPDPALRVILAAGYDPTERSPIFNSQFTIHDHGMSDTSRLYDLADQLYHLAPWAWMTEDQIIGIRHPETGEFAYISIMGALGSHLCLALYLGDEALHRFNLMQREDPCDPSFPQQDSLGLVLETRQLQVAFGSRQDLGKHEIASIKSLGRKYRGENWPSMRSYFPQTMGQGWHPPRLLPRFHHHHLLAA